jgi:hypothetical protein
MSFTNFAEYTNNNKLVFNKDNLRDNYTIALVHMYGDQIDNTQVINMRTYWYIKLKKSKPYELYANYHDADNLYCSSNYEIEEDMYYKELYLLKAVKYYLSL